MADCVLYRGDCIEIIPKLAAGSVNMVFADLPYGTTHQHWDRVIPMPLFWQAIHQAGDCKLTAALTCSMPFGGSLMESNKQHFRYDLVWVKSHAVGFANAPCRPLSGHENILISSKASCNPMSKNKMTYNAIMTQGKPYTRKSFQKDLKKGNNYGSGFLVKKANVSGLRHPKTVLEFAKCSSRIHPTQKPVALLEWLVKTYSNPGDTVLDPTFGSATTAVVCARLGRNFVGIEKDPEYFRIGCERLAIIRRDLGLSEAKVYV